MSSPYSVNLPLRKLISGWHLLALLLVACAPTPTPAPPATPTPTALATPSPSPSKGASGLVGPATSCTVWVSPNGRVSNTGLTRNSPWTLAKAATSSEPGATVCLMGGRYLGGNILTSNGTATQPITVQSAPSEWAILDQPNGIGGDASVGGAGSDYGEAPLFVSGNYVIIRDLEILVSNPDRRACRRVGVALIGLGSKAVNLIVHDAGVGMFPGEGQRGGEVYGSVFYNNGWIASASSRCSSGDRVVGPTGYGLYTQNTENTKIIDDNIITHNYNFGIHAYDSAGRKVKGFSLNRNAFVANGDQPAAFAGNNIYFGGGISGFTFSSNYVYNGGNRFGGRNSQDGSITNNIFAASRIETFGWAVFTFTGNKIVSPPSGNEFITIKAADLVNKASWNWNNQQYFRITPANVPFLIDGGPWGSFDGWRQATGFDSVTLLEDGDIPARRPTGVDYAVNPNKYQKGRANIFVANWDRLDAVSIDLKNCGLTEGRAYEVRDAQNVLGAAIVTGVYKTKNTVILLPMTSTAVAAPLGDAAPLHTDKEFGAFVLLPL